MVLKEIVLNCISKFKKTTFLTQKRQQRGSIFKKSVLMIRIAIQSELEMRRVSYAALLQQYSEFEVVFQANDNKELASQLAKKPVDVVLYCWNSANEIDFNAFDKLSKKHPGLTVLIATQDYYALTFQKVLDRNFMGYFRENSSVNELKKALCQLADTGCYHEEQLFIDHKKNVRNGKLIIDSRTQLTKKQLELLDSLFSDLTNEEVAKKHGLKTETVKSRRSSILVKTEKRSMLGACRFLAEQGVIKIDQLAVKLLLIFCLLGNGLDFSEELTSDDWESNSSYEWVKAG